MIDLVGVDFHLLVHLLQLLGLVECVMHRGSIQLGEHVLLAVEQIKFGVSELLIVDQRLLHGVGLLLLAHDCVDNN